MAKFNIKNLKQFEKSLDKRVIKGSEKELGRLIQRSVDLVKRTAVDSIASGGKSGRLYPRGNNPPHRASAAGEPPATDQGNLAGGISTKVTKESNEIIGQVLTNSDGHSEYGVHLEFGTKNILPRPFMQPALERNRPRIRRIFKDGGYIK